MCSALTRYTVMVHFGLSLSMDLVFWFRFRSEFLFLCWFGSLSVSMLKTWIKSQLYVYIGLINLRDSKQSALGFWTSTACHITWNLKHITQSLCQNHANTIRLAHFFLFKGIFLKSKTGGFINNNICNECERIENEKKSSIGMLKRNSTKTWKNSLWNK